jgi:hypothetical protein
MNDTSGLKETIFFDQYGATPLLCGYYIHLERVMDEHDRIFRFLDTVDSDDGMYLSRCIKQYNIFKDAESKYDDCPVSLLQIEREHNAWIVLNPDKSNLYKKAFNAVSELDKKIKESEDNLFPWCSEMRGLIGSLSEAKRGELEE